MSDHSEKTGPAPRRKSDTAIWLQVIGVLAVALCLIAIGFAVASGWSHWKAADLVLPMLALAAGLACGGLLWGVAAVLRVLRSLRDAILRLEGLSYDLKESSRAMAEVDRAPLRDPATPGGDPDETLFSTPLTPWRDIVTLLEDIRDNSLLNGDERQEKKLRFADEEIQNMAARIRALTAEGDYAQARELASATQRRFPNERRVFELIAQVEENRERHESDDVRSCTRQVEDLISVSAWGRARELAEQLRQRHPDSVEARQLLLRLEREHRLFDEEQRRRMNAEVQRFVTRRRWEEALAAARVFVERFPGCEESEALRMEIPTLKTNAEIEARQFLEAKIMDCARHGRYIEAVDLARKVIARFPESPQAEALRGQLERLEELAENPDAPPARIRID
jgi:tetratricopeptide (TPR) repeat protein